MTCFDTIREVRELLTRNRRANFLIVLLSPLLALFLAYLVWRYRVVPFYIAWLIITLVLAVSIWVILRVRDWIVLTPVAEAASLIDHGVGGKGRFLTVSTHPAGRQGDDSARESDTVVLSFVEQQATELVDKFNPKEHVVFSLAKESKMSLAASPIFAGLLLFIIYSHQTRVQSAEERMVSETRANELRNVVQELPKLPEELKDSLLDLADVIENEGLLSEDATVGIEESLAKVEEARNESKSGGEEPIEQAAPAKKDNPQDQKGSAQSGQSESSPPKEENKDEKSTDSTKDQQEKQQQTSKIEGEKKDSQSGEKDSQGKQFDNRQEQGKNDQAGSEKRQTQGNSKPGTKDSQASEQGNDGKNQQGDKGNNQGGNQGDSQGQDQNKQQQDDKKSTVGLGDSQGKGKGKKKEGSEKGGDEGSQSGTEQGDQKEGTQGSKAGSQGQGKSQEQDNSKPGAESSGKNANSAESAKTDFKKVEDKLNQIKQEMDKQGKGQSESPDSSGQSNQQQGQGSKQDQAQSSQDSQKKPNEQNSGNSKSENQASKSEQSKGKQGDSKSEDQKDNSEPKSPEGEHQGSNQKESTKNDKKTDQSQKRDTPAKESEHGIEGDRSLEGSENKGKDADRPLRVPKPGDNAQRYGPFDGGSGASLEGTKTGAQVSVPTTDEKITVRGVGKADSNTYLNSKQAKEKTQIRSQEFNKPEAESGKEKQPIPVEYRDWFR